jgi:hypothetical protein
MRSMNTPDEPDLNQLIFDNSLRLMKLSDALAKSAQQHEDSFGAVRIFLGDEEVCSLAPAQYIPQLAPPEWMLRPWEQLTRRERRRSRTFLRALRHR